MSIYLATFVVVKNDTTNMCQLAAEGTVDWLRGKCCAVVGFGVDAPLESELSSALEARGAIVVVVSDPQSPFNADGELDKAFAGVDFLFFVGRYISFARHDRQVVWQMNVDAEKSVYLAAENSGIKRIVHLSSVFALGHNLDHSPVDGSTPYLSDDQRSVCERSLFRQEMEAWCMAERGIGVSVVCGGLSVGSCSQYIDVAPYAHAFSSPKRLAKALVQASSVDMIGKRLVSAGLADNDGCASSEKRQSPIKSFIRNLFNIGGCRTAISALSRLGSFESQL